jgi:hypothetical protein
MFEIDPAAPADALAGIPQTFVVYAVDADGVQKHLLVQDDAVTNVIQAAAAFKVVSGGLGLTVQNVFEWLNVTNQNFTDFTSDPNFVAAI